MNRELPNAPEVEASLLGTLLQNEPSLHDCLPILNDECFYIQKHKDMWNTIIEVHKANQEINLVNVAVKLNDKGLGEQFGGFAGVAEFISSNFHADVVGCAKILHDRYVRRKIILESHNLQQKAYDTNNDIQSELVQSQNTLSEAISINLEQTSTANEVSMEIARTVSDNLGMFQEVTGVPTGYESYDRRIGGLSDEGDLIIIAARPAMGKTTFALNMALNAQKTFGYSGAFFSLEMSKKQLCRILIAAETGVSAKDLKKNKVREIQIEHIFNTLSSQTNDAQLYIDDTSSQLNYIVSKIYKLKRDHDIKFAVIDYMQLMTCEAKNNREKEIEHISRTLKLVAGALSIPIIPLCQLSRAVETRGGSKEPQLSDLRDSGSIEQDASVVTFLWRPEYYGILENEEGQSLKGITVLSTKKNRFGDIGRDFLYFDMPNSQFFDYSFEDDTKTSVYDYDMSLVEMQDFEKETILDFTSKIAL